MPVSEPTWKAQPQGPEYDAVRQRIVDAAEHLIRDGGVGALRQEAVAAHAGLARSSVYRYFDSKEELVTAAVVQSTLRIGARDPGGDRHRCRPRTAPGAGHHRRARGDGSGPVTARVDRAHVQSGDDQAGQHCIAARASVHCWSRCSSPLPSVASCVRG